MNEKPGTYEQPRFKNKIEEMRYGIIGEMLKLNPDQRKNLTEILGYNNIPEDTSDDELKNFLVEITKEIDTISDLEKLQTQISKPEVINPEREEN